ncbi:MAG: hypothetical protein JWR61_5283 [Ferruginibacter sp.]|uniref:hypothetical protein n=1 Tax=Ferruginibacter sp. TaxID=1940288 RepID=UPI002658F2FD|nr:hypothetical protein [Ferruginibacter sp.]MDB5280328.1 hypothetical protein [Ferruginibacter sp.]
MLIDQYYRHPCFNLLGSRFYLQPEFFVFYQKIRYDLWKQILLSNLRQYAQLSGCRFASTAGGLRSRNAAAFASFKNPDSYRECCAFFEFRKAVTEPKEASFAATVFNPKEGLRRLHLCKSIKPETSYDRFLT